jgi:dihydroxy-acid dehydratase
VCHVSPEAASGGPIALAQEGDEIELDIPNKRLMLHVPEEEMNRRRQSWRLPASKEGTTGKKSQRGYLARYTTMVSSASEGAILRAQKTDHQVQGK